MAAASILRLSLQPKPNPESSLVFSSPSPSSTRSRSISNVCGSRRRRLIASPSKTKRPIPAACSASPSPAVSETSKPQIELEFIGPKPGADGAYPVDRALEVSGEKLLRNIMSENKIELYDPYGKVMNCGGGGSCGTCIVEIVDGKDLLNERTDTEKQYLKKKPESWRLACQTIVGNKENAGKVVVQRLPQWKK